MDSTGSPESAGNREKCIQKRLKFSSDQDDKVSQVDRFSQLPEPIISSILSLVPTKHAVSTSLLSKGLSFCWQNCTSFDFDDELLFISSDNTTSVRSRLTDEKTSFVEFVEKVLSNITTNSITEFRLHCRAPDLLSKWVETAIDRNVRVLDLNAKFRAISRACLPDSLFTSETLEVMKVGGQIMVITPQLVFLPKVTVLELNNVVYKNGESLSNLISGCPLLHSLTVRKNGQCSRHDRSLWSDNLESCTISSPSLKRLQIYFELKKWILSQVKTKLEIEAPALESLILHDDISRNICIKGPTQYLKEVALNVLCALDDHHYHYNFGGEPISDEEEDDLPDKDEVVSGLVQTFGGHVEFMKLGRRTSEALFSCPPDLATFRRLTKLVVEDCEYATMIGLIDCCVKLQVLNTCGVKRFDDETFDVPGCVVSSLNHVSVLIRRNIFDNEEAAEMEMLKFLLENGAVLERVNLRFSKLIGNEARCCILDDVSKFARSSPTCEISCSDEEP